MKLLQSLFESICLSVHIIYEYAVISTYTDIIQVYIYIFSLLVFLSADVLFCKMKIITSAHLVAIIRHIIRRTVLKHWLL